VGLVETPYKVMTRVDVQCKVLCRSNGLTAAQAEAFTLAIKGQHRVNMVLDDLLVNVETMTEKDGHPLKTYERGFPVGSLEEDGKAVLHNHLRFTVMYRRDIETNLARIVGFKVEPFSVKHSYEGTWDVTGTRTLELTTCNPATMNFVTRLSPPQPVEADQEVLFTYDVLWQPSDVKWENRINPYLPKTNDRGYWISIMNRLRALSGTLAQMVLCGRS
jgi:transmembrane 9 superfamily protein 2/4